MMIVYLVGCCVGVVSIVKIYVGGFNVCCVLKGNQMCCFVFCCVLLLCFDICVCIFIDVVYFWIGDYDCMEIIIIMYCLLIVDDDYDIC